MINGAIKCPNCRFVIRNEYIPLGALFLDTLYNQTTLNNLNQNSNITIINNGHLFKRAELIDQ